ncbi:aminoglycoside phosphotransferase family protein [Streptomyces sp. LX-29]|uniref:aminoglycoside phosphotransferase family protein n=1 Tax=Streptomyces sp. LX-29 TaxID=2900152 RepID=UPI00240CF3FB|nr:aminoglycoside phosphotransferase family protein [Streptomyces sp. LX-29]WFB08411.1 aminoglycoside phosphotransferase family protein [Streptomyces sp. LX-29]
MSRIAVPAGLAAAYAEHGDESAAAWIAALPELADGFLQRWELRPDGPSAHGAAALVVPVRRADGTPAALKLQHVTDETVGEPLGLRAWAGDGVVRLLEHDEPSGTMLLERLDGRRSLASVRDPEVALLTLAGLLARLVAVPGPAGLRTLADVVDGVLADAPVALKAVPDADDRELLERCLAAAEEVRDEPGDRLLHWDLHYENVLASLPGSGRGPWLAIDPKPLVGDPGFDLLPALRNRWEDLVATDDLPRAIRRRFDLMTEVLGLDRQRAARWTLTRVLQNALWDLEDAEDAEDAADFEDDDELLQEEQLVIARALAPRLQ